MDEFGEPNEIQFDYSSVIFDRVEDISQQLDLHLGQLERLEEAVKPVNWLPRINTSVSHTAGATKLIVILLALILWRIW
jgi:hypothetical protein